MNTADSESNVLPRSPAADRTGAATSAPAIVAEGLTKRYKRRTVVDRLTLSVQPGEIFGILGANGAGKSTTVEMIAGLRKPDEGHTAVLGLDSRRDRRAVRQILGVQLQSAHLHGSLTVEELVHLYRSFYPHPRNADDLIELVGLGDQRRTRFDALSGGQQQRTSIALALAGKPRVLILDELTTGLDPRARRQMWGTIEQLRDEGCTIMLVSHAMEEVQRLCARVALLDAGRVIASGTPKDLIQRAGTDDLDSAFVHLTGTDPLEYT